jgi:phytoene dehydrogenase-like protein
MSARGHDAIVVGSGPNGLAAAITLARAGRSVLVLEAADTIGGGCRTAELTLPGFRHDVCSAFHPLALASPFFRSIPLAEHGLRLIQPPAPVAHPLDDGDAVTLERSLDDTAAGLGMDADAWRRLYTPLVDKWEVIIGDILAPIRPTRHPLILARFGLGAIRPAMKLAEARFRGERARALFAGIAAHSIMPLDRSLTASFGLMLGMLGHAVGWPVAAGGSQAIADTLAAYLRSLGGEIRTSARVDALDDLPEARAVVLDVAPRELVRLAHGQLPTRYAARLQRYRHGPGAFKVDWALAGPIPWLAHGCSRAGTVHVGGTLPEIAASERLVWEGSECPERPYVLVGQQSLFDDTRAPRGQHTAWAYCHVPNGSSTDMTALLEAQIERYAPGFRSLVLGRHVMGPAELEAYNPNYVGGDIVGGAHTPRQVFFRPAPRLNPYRTPRRGVYLCSSSTPPGGGVHGMCGVFAARSVLRDL